MELTYTQKDALTELLTLGYSRAAGALSELTDQRVELEVSGISVHAVDHLTHALAALARDEIASVNQAFSGPISGHAMLLFEEDAAHVLSSLLADEHSSGSALDAGEREIITEVGNILLNACLGVFGNLLHVPFSFAVPRLRVERLDTLLLTMTDRELCSALEIDTRFLLRAHNVAGRLVVMLAAAALGRILTELETWEQRLQL